MGKNQFIEEMRKLFGEGVDPYAIKARLEAEMNDGKPLGLGEVVTYCTHSEETRQALRESLRALQELQRSDETPHNPNTLDVKGSVIRSPNMAGRARRSTESAHLIEEVVIHHREREG